MPGAYQSSQLSIELNSTLIRSTVNELKQRMEILENTTMTRKPEDSFVTGDFIQCCDNFLKNNIDKFYNYAKHQETFRLQLTATNDEYENYQTWLESAYVDIILAKSERGELLLENDNVLEYLRIMNDLKTQRLKFVETINECKNLKRTVDLVNKDIVSLKSEYNNSNRSRLLDKNEPEKQLKVKFNDTINCCERLNCSFDTALKRIKMLNEKHSSSVERYRVLSENETVKEFLDYAKHQSKARLKITKTTDVGECLKSSQDPPSIDTASSLKSLLTETLKKLNSERLRCEVIENERNSLDKLSERLCRLLLKYQRSEIPEELNVGCPMINELNQKSAKDKNTSTDNSDIVVDSTSSSVSEIRTSKSNKDLKKSSQSQVSCFIEDAYEPVAIKVERTGSLDVSNENLNDNDEELAVIKEEKAVAFPIISTSSVVNTSTASTPSCSNSNTKKTGVSKKKCDTTTLSSERNEKNKSSSRNDSTNRRQLRKRKKIPHSKIKSSKSPKSPKKVCLGNLTEEHETFNCYKCGRSFIVKPNERKPQNCPFCDIIPAYIRVISKSPKSTVGTSATSHQSTSLVSNLPKHREVLS